MKYIFDFDDVLFHNTKLFKEHIFACLEKAGVPRERAEEYYRTVRENKFSLRVFINHLFVFGDVGKKVEDVYEEIMRECPNFQNNEVVKAVQRWGRKNCYIVTSGDEEFQRDKIERSGLAPFFLRAYTTSKGKTEAIRAICAEPENTGEQFVFFDDKPEFIKEINRKDFPNVEAVLYKPGDFEKFMEASNPSSELKRRK